MTPTEPPHILVSEQAWGDISPRAAIVHLVLVSNKVFSGRAALEKAIELRRLVVALAEHEIAESAVTLEGVSLDVTTGIFTRSSSATYRVRVHVQDLDKVPVVLEVISAAKQATLTHVEWDYTGSSTDDLLASCVARAAAKAKTIATSLGVTLANVHRVEAEPIDEGFPVPVMAAGGGMMRMRASSIPDALAGLELAPTKKIGVRVRVAYAI